MKIIKFLIFCLLGYSNISLANEDLNMRTNRDVFEKMPLISLQPMLNFCREKQPQLNVELEQAYLAVKQKLLNTAKVGKDIKYNGVSIFQETEMDQPIDPTFKQEIQNMLEVMSSSMRTVNAEKYCPFLIKRLNQFDEAEFQRMVEMQYFDYMNRATQKKARSQE